MPIYTNDPDFDEDVVHLRTPLRSSVGIGPKVTDSIKEATSEWLDEHPEATTTVPDRSITANKLARNAVNGLPLMSRSQIGVAKIGSDFEIVDQAIELRDGSIGADKLAINAINGLPIMSENHVGVAMVGAGLSMNGQALELDGSGDISVAVQSWLDAHPEATTTVEDGSIDSSKLADNSVTDAKLAQDNGILSVVYNGLIPSNFTDGMEWVLGTINGTTGRNADATNRIRSKYYNYVDAPFCYVTIGGGIKVGARIYSNNNVESFVRSVPWSTSGFTIDLSDGKYVRFIAAYEDDSEIADVEDISAYVIAVGYNYTDKSLALSDKAADAKVVGEIRDSLMSENLLTHTLMPYKETSRRVSINDKCYLKTHNFYIVRPHGAGTLNRTSNHRTVLYFMSSDDMAGLEHGVEYTISFDLTYCMFNASESSTRYINAYLYENKNGDTVDDNSIRDLISTDASMYKNLVTVTQYDKEVERSASDCFFTFELADDTTSFILFVAGSAPDNNSSYHVGNYMYLDNMRLTRGAMEMPWHPSRDDIGNTIVNRNVGMLEKLQQLKRPTRTGSRSLGTVPLCLLHFSDIHGDRYCLENIISFRDHYSDFIDDAIHTGDMVTTYSTDGIDFWSGTSGAETILNCIGNHDTRVGSDWTALSMANAYSTYFSGYIEEWDVTYESGKTYYYKDYLDNNVRLIVLDIMHQTAAQLSWFEGVLADALDNSLHVICACHARSHWQFDSYESPWDDKIHSPEYRNGYLDGDTSGNTVTRYPSNMSDSYASAVDEFINGGGSFVCWIHGHTHYKMLAKLHTHPNQLNVAVANAGGDEYAWTYVWDRVPWTKSMDDFNVLSIDTVSKVLKIMKVGVDYDHFMRHVDTVSYSYDTHELIYSN